jgi:diaminopimelate decarboxylase
MKHFPITTKMNPKGQVEIGGVNISSLASEYGTPLYVMDEKTIREKCREFKTALKSRYPNTEVIYACKAMCTTALLRLISDEGLGADVVSGGELYTALKAGINPRKIYFHGNNKSKVEIEYGLKSSVGRFVADNFEELCHLDKLSLKTGMRSNVLLRINPGVEAHTHEFIQTGQTDSKFGIPKERALEAVALISKMRNVNFVGLNAHIGSQIFDVASYSAEIDVLLNVAKEIFEKSKTEVEELNIGGGLGVRYLADDNAPSIDLFAQSTTSHLKGKLKALSLPEPKLIIEPGRSIVAQAGVTVYTVGVIKDVAGVRKYVVVDGGMADNPRPITYGARYDAVIHGKADQERIERVTIAGRFCESGDVLIKDIMLQGVEVGDLIVIPVTGAYNYSMSSNYNRVPRPAMVMVSDGNASEMIARETYEDLAAHDSVIEL